MHAFEWNLPTRVVYGAGRLAEIGALTKEYGAKVLLVSYGQGSALRALVDRTAALLRATDLDVVIFDEIEPNPRSSTVDRGVALFKETARDVVVAVGGGSVIDGAKYIASVAWSGGSSWDYVQLNYRPARAYTGGYPIIAVPTVSAAGSEANAGGVLTNWETNEKSFSRHPARIPKVAIVDPEVLATVPRGVTADGGVDIFSHLIEHYLSSPDESEIADRLTEGMILTLMEYLPRALARGDDLEARGQVALCALFGWSGLQSLGRLGGIPIHLFEHQLSGHYDLAHGRGMCILMPPYLAHFADAKPARWAKLARRAFGITEADDAVAALELAPALRAWLRSLAMDLRLADVGIGAEKFDQLIDETFAMYAMADGTIPGTRDMTRQDMRAVLTAAL